MAAPSFSSPSSESPAAQAQPSLLVVEDERALRRLLEYRLGKHYQVRTASHGEEALDQIHEYLPDLIVSDIMMPHMDGFALQEELQSDKNTRVIPFIFLTAKSDEDSRLKGLRTGVDDYITKPFDTEQLLTRIDRLMERTQVFRENLGAEIGQDFSERLMPRSLPEPAGYDTTFVNRPREQGGGDFFAWTEAEEGVFYLTLGDVMGKHLQAKFYAYTFLSYIRGTVHAMVEETTSPAALMTRVNEVLVSDEIVEETFASLIIVRWNANDHTITYTNAGHCHPLLLSAGADRIVEPSDLILGVEPGAAFHDHGLQLDPGDALLLYTDGLVEQSLESGNMIGEEGVLPIAADARSLDEPLSGMIQAIEPHTPGETFEDDLLMFWLQREEN
jgi:sigma-B regulation protein RsbU (phosphoserine phosphatase)